MSERQYQESLDNRPIRATRAERAAARRVIAALPGTTPDTIREWFDALDLWPDRDDADPLTAPPMSYVN